MATHTEQANSDDENTPRRRRADLREDIETAVVIAVRQAMTPFSLRIEHLENLANKLSMVVFGDVQTEQTGLAKQVRTLAEKLDVIIEQRRSTTVLLRGVAVGLALNLLASAPELIRIVKSILGALP